MTLLNYSVYAETISSAFFNTEKTYITQTLFGFLDDCPDILNSKKEAFDISNQIASNWWNQKTPIPFNIRKGLQREAVVQIVINYFKNNLTTELSVNRLDKPLTRLVTLVKEQEINAASKAEILGYYKANNYTEFLAHTFILAVQQSNKKKTVDIDTVLKNKKSTPKGAITDKIIANDATYYNSQEVFKKYLEKAIYHYSQKKTLLYAEKPRSFYDMFVCNDIRYHTPRNNEYNISCPSPSLSNATIQALRSISLYIIIEGTGGIGKSMFLTHLFLSSAKDYSSTKELPVLISLKDYKATTVSITELLWSNVNAFDSNIEQQNVVKELENHGVIVLLDGFDEIQSSVRESFEKNLEKFIKNYPMIPIIITSRSVDSFVSFNRFSLLDIQPLTEEQSVALIDKLEFWDIEAKQRFKNALKDYLYHTHYEFASNPLLLTIMLMTYSYFGDIPAKMHIFYSQAFETMARLHDATKGAYVRPFNTGLTPEEFKKPFSEFCARSYADEEFDFTDDRFSFYMEIALKESSLDKKIEVRDFLLDLTNNLCIMYHEGNKIYFIHRSFQEYFAALFFSNVYDYRLQRVGEFFDTKPKRSFYDKTFDMLYDMIPKRVERYIFFPFLQSKFNEWQNADPDEMYWNFLEDQYPTIYYEDGNTKVEVDNTPKSFLYRFIVREKKIHFANYLMSSLLNIHVNERNPDFPTHLELLDMDWPDEVFSLPTQEWVSAYTSFINSRAFDEYPSPKKIPKSRLKEMTLINKNNLSDKYIDYFGEPMRKGFRVKIEIDRIRKSQNKYSTLRKFMTKADFPFMLEYTKLKEYFYSIQSRIQTEEKSAGLFSDIS